LLSLREQAERGPSDRATEAQHAKGKLTARERVLNKFLQVLHRITLIFLPPFCLLNTYTRKNVQ
ncbi:hypothetical protein, partial [Streptomyces zhihengii]|uniref:hypothetical protein n=1 Tax=Streptomyces zhihengii TaxID=1818004 RepID=UPI0033A7188E